MPLVKFRIYRPDKSVDVDIFIVESTFQKLTMERRVRAELLGRRVWLISAEDLVPLGGATGRACVA